MRRLTIMYTDLALESLCGDLEWELLKLVQVAGDSRGDVALNLVEGRRSRTFGGEVLVLQCRGLETEDMLELSARLAVEQEPQYHGVGLEWGLLRAKLAVGSGDPLGLLWEYCSRHGHRPVAPSPQILAA